MGDEIRPGVSVQHELKTWPAFFQAIVDGRKTFDLRKDDRGFQEGDVIRLVEWCPEPYATCQGGHPGARADHPTCGTTGRSLLVRVGYVMPAPAAPQAGLADGYAILSLAPLEGHPAEQALDRLLRALLPAHGDPTVEAAIERVKALNVLEARQPDLLQEANDLVERLGVMRRRLHGVIAELAATAHDVNCPAGWYDDAGRAGQCVCGVSAWIVKLGAIIGVGEAPTRQAYTDLLEAARMGLRWLEENRPDCEALVALRDAIAAVENGDSHRLVSPPPPPAPEEPA